MEILFDALTRPLASIGNFAILLFLYLVVLPGAFLVFAAIFFRASNAVGLKALRRVGEKLQIPIIYYRHHHTGRRVALIGAMHTAEAGYFARIQSTISSLSGYKVLFESVEELTPEQRNSLTVKEREIADQLEALRGMMKLITETLGLQYQKKSALSYDNSWIRTDVSFYDVIRALARENAPLLKKHLDLERFKREVEPPMLRYAMNFLLKNIIPILITVTALSLLSRRKRAIRRILLYDRDKIAFSGIEEHVKGGYDVVSIWGAAHLYGIDKRLKKAGFRETGKQWLTAYHARPYPYPKPDKKLAEKAA